MAYDVDRSSIVIIQHRFELIVSSPAQLEGTAFSTSRVSTPVSMPIHFCGSFRVVLIGPENQPFHENTLSVATTIFSCAGLKPLVQYTPP